MIVEGTLLLNPVAKNTRQKRLYTASKGGKSEYGRHTRVLKGHAISHINTFLSNPHRYLYSSLFLSLICMLLCEGHLYIAQRSLRATPTVHIALKRPRPH